MRKVRIDAFGFGCAVASYPRVTDAEGVPGLQPTFPYNVIAADNAGIPLCMCVIAVGLEITSRMIHMCLMRDESVSKTELALISAGFTVFSRNPGASLAEVAKAADVGRATLHRYFPSRADLFSALARYAMRELDEAVSVATADAQSYYDALRLVMGAVIPLAHRHMFLTHENVEDPELEKALVRQTQDLRDLIDAAKREGTLRDEQPTEWVAQAYDHLIYAAWMMIQREEATPRQAVELAWTQFSKGAGA